VKGVSGGGRVRKKSGGIEEKLVSSSGHGNVLAVSGKARQHYDSTIDPGK
jgi:hypothetical protein